MKKMVSIARALKEKNRVAGRLAKARQLVNKENSQEEKIPRSIDVRFTDHDGGMRFPQGIIDSGEK